MAVQTDYTYTKFPCDGAVLQSLIAASAISVAVQHIGTVDTTVTVTMKDALSTDDKTTLDAVVAAYDGSPMPETPNEVITQLEKNDKTLKLACAMGTFDATTNLAVCEIVIPGIFGGFAYDAPGRFVAGGYAFTDAGKVGDRCTKIEVVDKDNLLGAGAGYIVKTYHDQDVDPSMAGWYLYAAPGGQQEVEIDPIGGYGKIPAGLYLRVTFERVAGSTATKVATNIWWGELG